MAASSASANTRASSGFSPRPPKPTYLPASPGRRNLRVIGCAASRNHLKIYAASKTRRDTLESLLVSGALFVSSAGAVVAGGTDMAAAAPAASLHPHPTVATKNSDVPESRLRYDDFTLTPSGLQYKDVRPGTGEVAKAGDAVIVDWGGWTIGYYGRPFEARNKTKGGDFTGEEKDFLHFTLGKGEVIPGFEEATIGMQVGGVRRVIVPEYLSYPDNTSSPRPSSFSGKRALGNVLQSKGIDKTLLFDIELLRVE